MVLALVNKAFAACLRAIALIVLTNRVAALCERLKLARKKNAELLQSSVSEPLLKMLVIAERRKLFGQFPTDEQRQSARKRYQRDLWRKTKVQCAWVQQAMLQ